MEFLPRGGEAGAAAAPAAATPLEGYRRWYLANATWLVRNPPPATLPPFAPSPSPAALVCGRRGSVGLADAGPASSLRVPGPG